MSSLALARIGVIVLFGAVSACGGRGPTFEDLGATPGPSGSCRPGAQLCDGFCTEVRFDPDHCGDCAARCPSDRVCAEGVCGLACSAGTSSCGRRCVDLDADPDSCGACGARCGEGEVCSHARCADSCDTGLASCDGGCVDLDFDPRHCGACANVCPSGSFCAEGSCVDDCPAPFVACDGLCVDTSFDPDHCGGCGSACADAQVCTFGACALDCAGGTTRCADRCVDVDGDEENCGACGISCGPDRVCRQASCASVCGDGLEKCGRECVDLTTDREHCGACGVECTPGQKCAPTGCVACDSTLEDCDADGFLVQDGDCCDKPGLCGSNAELVNPGALEVIGNGVDDDCNGKADLFDRAEPCDAHLASDSNDPLDYARALGLCRLTTEHPASLAEKTWGLISAELLRADGAPLGFVNARSIRSSFGSIGVTEGSAFAVLSTGVAADASQTRPGPNGGAPLGFTVSHNQQSGPLDFLSCSEPGCVGDWFAAANPPLKAAFDFPRAPGCGAISTSATDSVLLLVRVRAPTNVRAFSFNSYFLSAEYPEYVCDQFNDQFVALVDTPSGEPEPIPNPPDKNLLTSTRDGASWPIGINVAAGTNLFAVCAPEPDNPCWFPVVDPASCSEGGGDLIGTGFEANATLDPACTIGGGTGWLTTAGNVIPGEIVELRIALWDVGDPHFDSTALVDGWNWLPNATLPGTN